LFLQFQEKAHFVYVTGDRDTARFAWDFASMHSLRDWCVFNVEYQTNNFTDHEVMGPEALSRALDSLAKPIEADAGRLAKCRAGIDTELESKLRQVQALISAGNRDAACRYPEGYRHALRRPRHSTNTRVGKQARQTRREAVVRTPMCGKFTQMMSWRDLRDLSGLIDPLRSPSILFTESPERSRPPAM